MSRKCEPGCTCGRHKTQSCQPGCTCGRHQIPRCEEGCQCYRHRGGIFDPNNYAGNHVRVRETRGKAAERDCVDCGKVAAEWSHTHDTDPTDPQNYSPRCNKCHRVYDEISERLTGITRSAETRAKIAAKRRGTVTPQHVRDAISASLKGREFSDEHRSKISDGVKRMHERHRNESSND